MSVHAFLALSFLGFIAAAPVPVASSIPYPSLPKKGFSYNDAGLTNLFTSGSWAYNWGSTPGIGLKAGLQYVPMLWGLNPDHTGSWQTDVEAALAAGADSILSFNEPDHPQQSNLDPSQAAAGYRQHIQPYGSRARLGAPAVTNGGAPMGLTWLKSFLSACSDCQIDFVPIHIYDSATNIDYFKSYLQQAHDTSGGRPIWVTEFGVTGSDSQIQSFMNDFLPWMDAQPWVERYAYFMASPGILISPASTGLSAIGAAYNA